MMVALSRTRHASGTDSGGAAPGGSGPAAKWERDRALAMNACSGSGQCPASWTLRRTQRARSPHMPLVVQQGACDVARELRCGAGRSGGSHPEVLVQHDGGGRAQRQPRRLAHVGLSCGKGLELRHHVAQRMRRWAHMLLWRHACQEGIHIQGRGALLQQHGRQAG